MEGRTLNIERRYDHPAAEIGILRSLPWLVRDQNDDGAWGEGGKRDSATRIVLEALQVLLVRPLAGLAQLLPAVRPRSLRTDDWDC